MRIGATAWIINSDYPTQKLNPLGDDKRTTKQRYKIQQQIELYKVFKVFNFQMELQELFKNKARIQKKAIKKLKC